MNNSPIGVFDSGVGGLSVFSLLEKLLPEEDYIYFGDTANLPYGNKTKQQLIKITSNIFDFFERKNVKAVVMACNTTSAMVYDVLKNQYKFKIYPLVQSVSKYIAAQNYAKTGVFATNATINSHAYKREIQKYNPCCTVFEQACPLWVNFVENKMYNGNKCKAQIKSDLDKMLEHAPDRIILGCTHYPYLLDTLSEFIGKNLFINPAEYFTRRIMQDLKDNGLLNTKRSFDPEFFVSANPKKFIESAELFYNVKNVHEIQTEILI